MVRLLADLVNSIMQFHYYVRMLRTETSIRGEKHLRARDQVWAATKTGATTLQSLFTKSIMVPYIKQKASKSSGSGGRIYT